MGATLLIVMSLQPTELKIFVKTESGKIIELNVFSTDTILSVKQKIEELEKIPIYK